MALPLPPTHLLTVREYAQLGEDTQGRTELQEGSLVMSPSPSLDHNTAALRIAVQLGPQLPHHLSTVIDVDMNLDLVPVDEPGGSSRRPDVVVFDAAAKSRLRQEGGILSAHDVVVAIEIVSPGSRRTDNIVKRAEYADAGIPHYWIVDIDGPVSLVSCRLTEKFGYIDDVVATGTFSTEKPFPVTLNLDELR
jgi:Uma2 family endonuclease